MLTSAAVIYSMHMLKHFYIRHRIPLSFLINFQFAYIILLGFVWLLHELLFAYKQG